MQTAARPTPTTRAAPSGARSGALIAGASLLATALNYAFLLAAGRILGKDDYGALAALMGLLTVILLPAGALQLAVSREVSRRLAVGDEKGADALGRAVLRLGLLVTLPLVAAGLILVVPLRELLNIDSTAAVFLTVSGLIAALAYPIAVGILQGQQRFDAVAALYVLPFALRLALLPIAVAVGFRLGGAVVAAILGGILSAGVAIGLLREPLRRGALAVRPALGPFLRYLGPVIVGLIGIAFLTTVDLLVVKARFSDEAGEYAAASAFARVAFFLPATILAVLFPRAAARQARGEDTADILGRSLLVTAGFGALLTLFYAMAGRGLVHTSFGPEFAEGGELLVLFTISMTLFALANVLVGYHLSRDESRYAWIVAAAIPVQIVALGLLPSSVEGVILVDVVVGTALLAAHELLVDTSVPAILAGFRRFSSVAAVRFGHVAIEAFLVLLGTTAFVCFLFWPFVANLGSTVAGPGSDATGTAWWFWQLDQESGYHLFGTTHHTLTGAPFGWEGDNGLNIQWLLPYYPAYLAETVVGPVAALNLALLSGYVLSGAAMYLLTRYLRCGRLVSAWAALAYIVFPWHLARTEHASLTHLEFFPLLVLALIAAARKPTWPRLSFVGLATLACWLTSGYFGVMAVVIVAVFAVGVVLAGAPERTRILFGFPASAVVASAVVVLLTMIAGISRDAGLDRLPRDLDAYGIRPLELLVPPAGNLVLGDWPWSLFELGQHGSNPTETSAYLGLVTIGLAVAWVVLAWRRRALIGTRTRLATAGLVAVVPAALVLALPSPVTLLGRQIWMPSRLLWEIVPAIRVPSRWVLVVMAALVPLAALALQEAWVALGRRGRRWRGVPLAATALVTALIAASFVELAISPAKSRIRTDRVPAEYQALSRLPPGVLAEYPLIENVDHLFWQRIHKRPVLNSSAFGQLTDEVRRVLVDPAAPGTAANLAFLGVTGIVTHRDALSFTDRVRETPDASWGPGYALVARTDDGASVWRVTAPAAPAVVTLSGGFADPTAPVDGVVGYPFVAPSGVGTIGFIAKAPGVVRLMFDATPPEGTTRVLRLADADEEYPFTLNGRTPVSITVQVPRGRSYILVKTDPAATSVDDAILFSAPRAACSAEAPVLEAETVSDDPGF